MASAPTREIDFFAMEKTQTRRRQQHQEDGFPSPRGVSVRDIHRAAARMDPRLLRSLINSRPPPPPPPPLSDFPSSRSVSEIPRGGGEEGSSMCPLTIFYNGSVRVYDVPHHMAEGIIKLAAQKVGDPPEPAVDSSPVAGAGATAHQGYQHQEKMLLEGDLPLYRKRSLQRFLEKRRERLASFSQYPPSASSSSTSGNYNLCPRRRQERGDL